MADLTPAQLESILQRGEKLGIVPSMAIETGTYRAKTTFLLCGFFDVVFSVELSTELYRQANNLRHSRAVFFQGNSPDVLPAIMRDVSTLFFLDAHWWDKSGEHDIVGEGEQPLFDELSVIRSRPWADIIVVDDIHAFGKLEYWGAITQESIVDMIGTRIADSQAAGDQFVIFREGVNGCAPSDK